MSSFIKFQTQKPYFYHPQADPEQVCPFEYNGFTFSPELPSVLCYQHFFREDARNDLDTEVN